MGTVLSTLQEYLPSWSISSVLVALSIALVVGYILHLVRKGASTHAVSTGPFFYLSNRFKLPQKMHEFILQNKPKDFLQSWVANKLILMAIEPEAAKYILTQREIFTKDFAFGVRSLRYLIQNNLVGTDGADWRRQRSFFTSAFSSEAYATYYPVFLEKSDKFISKLDSIIESSKKEKDSDIRITPYLRQFTIDVLGKSIFNYEFDSMDNKMDEYYDSYQYISKSVILLHYEFFPWLEKLPLSTTKKIHNAHNNIRSLFTKLIKEHREKEHYKSDILSHLISASQNVEGTLTQEELISNIYVLFLAGHETTSASIGYALYELYMNPDIQEKLYEEIQTRIGNRAPTLKELENFTLLNNFVSETLRLHPPITELLGRTAQKDSVFNGIFIPKGTLVGVSPYAIHRNETYWSNPEKFDPDRFLPENKKGMNRFAYLPFSLGPRQCIGNVFASIEENVFIVRLLQSYKVLPPLHNVVTLEREQDYTVHMIVNLEKRK